MDDQAFCIADIGEVGEQLDAVDHLHADLVAALDAKGEDRARALGQVFPGERVILVVGQAGIIHPSDGRVLVEILRDLERIGAVALHAQPERLDAEHGEPGIERRLAGTEIAQANGVAVESVGHVAEGLEEVEAVIGGFGAGEARELATFGPVELA
jgi:hypothetical protein